MSLPTKKQRQRVPTYDEVMQQEQPPTKIPSFQEVMGEKKNLGEPSLPTSSQNTSSVSETPSLENEKIPIVSLEDDNKLDDFDLANKYNELKTSQINTKADESLDLSGGIVGDALDKVKGTKTKESDDYKKQADNLKDFMVNARGVNPEELYKETGRLTPNDYTKISKEELRADRDNNYNLYLRKVARLNWSRDLENALKLNVDRGAITPEDYEVVNHNIKSSLDNSGVGDYTQQRDKIKGVATLIKTYGGENADDILKDYAVEASKVYGNSYNNDFEKSIKDTPESKYLNSDAQLGLQFIKDLNPEKAAQYDRLLIDQNSLKGKPDEQRGYNHLMQTLEETGISLTQNSVTEELNNLNAVAQRNGGLDPSQLERAKKLEAKQNEIDKKVAELDSKYPDRRENKIDDAMQEVLGQDISWGNYAGGKTWLGIKHTGQGIWEAVSSPFMSDESNNMRELGMMGEQMEENSIYHTTDKNKSFTGDKLVIDPELQKQIDVIKNDTSLSKDEKKAKLYPLLRENMDKFGRVPITNGKFDPSPSSILYGVTDIGTSLIPFIGLEALTGGGATASATRKFLSTFAAAGATTFHDEYTNELMEGKPRSEAYKNAMGKTAISSFAMAGAGTAEAVKAMAGTKTSIGKIISQMSNKDIEKVLAEGTPKGFKAISQTIKDRIKATPQMALGGLKAGGKFEVAMTGANELKHQIYGDHIDRTQNLKQSLLQIANFGILGAGLGHIGYKTPSEIQKSGLIEMGKNPTEFLAIAEAMRKDGKLSQEEFDHRKILIDFSEKAYKTIPQADAKGKKLNEIDKGNYMYNNIIKNEGYKAAKELPPKQAEKAEMTAMVADHANDLILNPQTDKQLESRKSKLKKDIEAKDENGKSILNDKEKLNSKAELEAIDNEIKTRESFAKVEMNRKDLETTELPTLSEPIDGVNNSGIPLGENEIVPKEQKPNDVSVLTKDAEDLLASIKEGSKPAMITKNLERIAKENGIEVTDKTTPDDIINQLKEKKTKPDVSVLEGEAKDFIAKDIEFIQKNIPKVGPLKEQWEGYLNQLQTNPLEYYQKQEKIFRDRAKVYKDAGNEGQYKELTSIADENLQKINKLKSESKPSVLEGDVKLKEFPKPEVPISEMNSEQLINHAKVVKDFLKNQEVEYFGVEGAKRYKELQAISNDRFANADDVKAADVEIKKMEDSLTKEQYNRFFGIGEQDGIYDPSEIRNIASKVSIIEQAEDINDLASSLKLPLLDFKKDKNNEGTLAILNAAKRKAIELGINPTELFVEAVKKIGKDLPDKEDAAFLAQSILDEISQPKEKAQLTTNDNGQPKEKEVPSNIIKEKGVEGDTVGNEPIATETGIPPKEPITENISGTEGGVNTAEGEGGKEWEAIRKEKQIELEKVKASYDKQKVKTWDETMGNGLSKVQKMYPEKNLYDATTSLMHQMRLGGGHGDLTPDEAVAAMHYLKMETKAKRGELVNRKDADGVSVLQSENDITRGVAALEDDALKDRYEDAALAAKTITTQAGRTLNYAQAEIMNDPENGLQIRRMELSKAKGEPLSDADMKWTKEMHDKEMELQKQEAEIRSKEQQAQFDQKISDLQKEYEAKLRQASNTPKGRATKEQTLNQKGDKSLADKIRGLKMTGAKVDFTLGGWNLFVESVAKIVEAGKSIKEAIQQLIDEKKIGFKTDKDRNDAEALLVEKITKPTVGETLDKIKEFVKENDVSDITNEMVSKNLIRDYVNSHIGEVEQAEVINEAHKALKVVLPSVTKATIIEAYLKKGDFEQPTKKQLEGGLRDAQIELKKLAKKSLTEDQEQKLKTSQEIKNAEKKIKEYKKKLENKDFERDDTRTGLQKESADLIRIKKQQSLIENEYRKKQKEYEENRKGKLGKVPDLLRSIYVNILIGSYHTLAKVGEMGIGRPTWETIRRKTVNKITKSLLPNLSQAALRGGEGSNWVSEGWKALKSIYSDADLERIYDKRSNEYDEAAKKYVDYAKSDNPNPSTLKKLKSDADDKLVKAQGTMLYKFIGGSSVKDMLVALVERSNQIEKQFGDLQVEKFKGADAIDKTKYLIGFIGRSHGMLKTPSGRFSFAVGFMARLEGALKAGEELNGDKMLEIANESYLDWQRGKYQQDNAVTDITNYIKRQLANPNKSITDKTVLKGAQAVNWLMAMDVPIARVPLNLLHEKLVEYGMGLFKAAYMSAKEMKGIRRGMKEEGITKDNGFNEEEIKKEFTERVKSLDPKQAATIVRCISKGGIGAAMGVSVYLLHLFMGLNFGGLQHKGQKKSKDDELLKEDELNPGQVEINKQKFGKGWSDMITHNQALYPGLLGLSMAQAYNDEIDKGTKPTDAIVKDIWQHVKTVEGEVPQSKLISPTGVIEGVTKGVKSKLQGAYDWGKELLTGEKPTPPEKPKKKKKTEQKQKLGNN